MVIAFSKPTLTTSELAERYTEREMFMQNLLGNAAKAFKVAVR